MALPKSILFPVDFSDRCRSLWPAVAAMAQQLDAGVTILHAIDVGNPEWPTLAHQMEAIRADAWQKLEQFTVRSQGDHKLEVLEGPAALCIVGRAAKMESPLIMLPTRGHTRFRQLLLGSVTAAVLHDAVCPVWTDAHSERDAVGTGACHSIVCAVDMGPGTPEILATAGQFSQRFGATLRVVHSVTAIDPRFPSGAADLAHAFLVDRAREEFAVHCREAGQTLELEIVQDTGPVEGITAAVRRHGADLLVIGRGVIQGTLGRLRTNAHDLIRQSPCPVLSV